MFFRDDLDGPLTARNFDLRVKPLRPALLKLARRQLMPDDAEDCIQTSICNAWCNRECFDATTGQSGLAHWLRLLVRRSIADFYRTMNRRPEDIGLPEGYAETARPSEVETAYDEATRADLVRRWDRVELTPKQEEILCSVLQGQTQVSIAERLHLSHNTVNYHIKMAVRRLQEPGEVEISIWAQHLFEEASAVTVYRKPAACWDRTGTSEEIEHRRYRDMRTVKPSPAQRRAMARNVIIR